jgi:hypothetical protein
MAAKLRAPKFEEGFSKITIVKLKKSAADATPVEVPTEPQAEVEENAPTHEPEDFNHE